MCLKDSPKFFLLNIPLLFIKEFCSEMLMKPFRSRCELDLGSSHLSDVGLKGHCTATGSYSGLAAPTLQGYKNFSDIFLEFHLFAIPDDLNRRSHGFSSKSRSEKIYFVDSSAVMKKF